MSAFDIALIGWGTRGVDQITVEQLRALAEAKHIAIDPGATPDIFRMLDAYGAEKHDLASLYRDGAEKGDVYPAMAARVLELAALGPTVWLTYGHPLVCSRPSQILIRESRARGLRLSILSGISSIDEIMTVLGLDIGERDLQIYFANHLVAQKKRVDPSVDLLIMQPGGLCETKLCRDPGERRTRDLSAYRALQSHMETFYPADHRFTSVCLSDQSGGRHEIFDARIAQIVELAPELHYGHTWFVPALTPAAEP